MKSRSFNTLIVFSLLLSLLGSALTVTRAQAATLTVSTCNETALRAQITAAASSDTIKFSCSGTITLLSTILISKDLTIDGTGQSVIISGGGADQVLIVGVGYSLTLNNLTIANGNYIGGFGGGVDNNGLLTVTNSTFSGNSAFYGGAIYNNPQSTVTITNSTFYGNSAANGGVIFNSRGTVKIFNSTFSGNTATNAGAIYNFGLVSAGVTYPATLQVRDSIFWGDGSEIFSTSESIPIFGLDVDDSVVEGGCGACSIFSTIITSDPFLKTLADNGGSTKTMALGSGSSAIDKAGLCVATDQRGATRPQGAKCDIGAYEASVLGNLVWNDLNNDGIKNGVEAGIDNVTVELWSGNGSTLIKTTTTSGGGFYTFDTLSAGSYIVRLPAINFNPGGVLRDYNSSTGQIPTLAYEPAPDANTNTTDSDDNGTETNGLLGLGGYIQTLLITIPSSAPMAVDFGVNNLPRIDLTVTKTDGLASYNAGSTLTYTIVVSNNGPADAGDPNTPTPGTGMTISDTRPPQITSWTWTCDSATYTYWDTSTLPPTLVTTSVPPTNYGCDNGTGAPFTDELFLPQLATVTYKVVAQVASLATGTLTNSVSVIPPTGMSDLTPYDNTAIDTNNNSFPLVSATSLQATYTGTGPSTFTVTFNEDVNNPAGDTSADDVTNPANYLLVEKGANKTADTISCKGGVKTDDSKVNVAGVSYTTPTAIVNLGNALPAGNYRLFVCGTTSITDLAGNHLNNGVDFTFDFTVNGTTTAVTTTSSSASSSSSSTSRFRLPGTGFAPSTVTSLPQQPADLAYTQLGDLWLEIPSLNLKTSIVGVPLGEKNVWDVKWLGMDAGWLNDTAFPTWTGNSVITGHVYGADGLPGIFVNLKDLRKGDQVIVHMGGEKYIFEVQKSKLVRPDTTAFAFEHLEKNSYLTLITCSGYNEQNGSYRFRRVVRAVLVDVQ